MFRVCAAASNKVESMETEEQRTATSLQHARPRSRVHTRKHTQRSRFVYLRYSYVCFGFCLLLFFVASIVLPMYEQVHESNYSKFYIRTRGSVVLWPWILCDAFFFSLLIPSSTNNAIPCPYFVAVVTFIACEKQRNTLSNLNCNVFKYFWNIKIPYSSQIVNVQEVHALLFICDTAYARTQPIHTHTHTRARRRANELVSE